MRLVRRLTVYLFFVVVLILGLDTALVVREQLVLFTADMRRDERHLGKSLGQAVERAWQDHGEDYALALVTGADDPTAAARVRFVRLDAPAGAPDAPAAPRAALPADRPEHDAFHARDAERVYTYVPLAIAGEPSAALELSESVDSERAYMVSWFRRELRTAAVMALAFGLVAWVLGVRVVGRPIRALVEKARRVGEGDFTRPLVLRQHDELSLLADEMNLMAEHLDAAARRVASESEARIATLEQLRHADRLTTVGKLASGLAHELGTPLNVVSGRARMIASGEVDDPREIPKIAQIIADQADRMAKIVRQLLDFGRRRSPERRSTDLAELARQTAALLAPLAARRRVTLECDAAAPPLRASVDPSQVQQSLTNVLVNAIQAMQAPGPVSLRVKAVRLEPGSRHAAGPYVVLEVEDTGEGIAAEQLPAIFDPFYTTKPVGEGTGLGLSVAYAIAQEHGGWIDVESEPGRGSVFRIWLPAESAA